MVFKVNLTKVSTVRSVLVTATTTLSVPFPRLMTSKSNVLFRLGEAGEAVAWAATTLTAPLKPTVTLTMLLMTGE